LPGEKPREPGGGSVHWHGGVRHIERGGKRGDGRDKDEKGLAIGKKGESLGGQRVGNLFTQGGATKIKGDMMPGEKEEKGRLGHWVK